MAQIVSVQPNATSPTFAASMADSRVSAGIVVVRWNEVQPFKATTFDWSLIDNFLPLIPQGKGFWIDIFAGLATPNWVYTAGAQSFQFVWDVAGVQGNKFPFLGRTTSIPVPWDPTYRFYWKALIAAMGQRYAGHPQLVGIKLTPFCSKTDECFLPNAPAVTSIAGTNGKPSGFFTLNDNQNWFNIGYSLANLRIAFNDLNSQYVASFPNLPLSVQWLPAGFPQDPLSIQVLNLKDLGAIEQSLNVQGYANVPNYETQNNGFSQTNHVGGVQSYQEGGVLGKGMQLAVQTHVFVLGAGYTGASLLMPKRWEIYDPDIVLAANSGILNFMYNTAPSNNLPLGNSNPADGTLLL